MNNYNREDISGYCYVDYHNPMAVWNIARGAFDSPAMIENGNVPLLSMNFAGLLGNQNANRLISELSLDSFRQINYPNCVSRLRGIFIFDDQESICRFWEKNDWGQHFRDEYFTSIGASTYKSTVLDSSWISNIFNVDGSLKDDWEQYAHGYWSGQAYNDSPIWERIIEGTITIWDQDARINAVQEVSSMWENSALLLHYACACAAYGSNDGQVFPHLMRDNENYTMQFYFKAEHMHDGEFIRRIMENLNTIPSIDTGIVYPVNNETANLPDLSGFGTTFSSAPSDSFNVLANILNEAYRDDDI